MDVDENLKQNYIQYDPAPRKGNEVEKKRVPDYFLWSFMAYLEITTQQLFRMCVLLREGKLGWAE